MNAPVERLLRETLDAHSVTPGVGLLERAMHDGRRLRRRRRAVAVTASVGAMVTIAGTGAALSPHLFGRALVVRPAGPGQGLRVDDSPPPPVQATETTLWTDTSGGHAVTMVVTFTDEGLCVGARSSGASGDFASARCSTRHATPWLLGGPIGGLTGVRQGSTSVTHLLFAGAPGLATLGVSLYGGGFVSGYASTVAGARVFDVILPLGVPIERIGGEFNGKPVSVEPTAFGR